MDLRMPVMDGLEAAAAIRRSVARDHPPYIMALTANAHSEDQAACAAAGMHDFMSKPVQLEKLAAGLIRGHRWLSHCGTPARILPELTGKS
jgi:CheY-like chemotaxis protein